MIVKEKRKELPIGQASYVLLSNKTLHSSYFYNLSEIKEFFWKFNFPYNSNLKPKENFYNLSAYMFENKKSIIYYNFYE